MIFPKPEAILDLPAAEAAAAIAGWKGTLTVEAIDLIARFAELAATKPEFLEECNSRLSMTTSEGAVWQHALLLEKLKRPSDAADVLHRLWWTTEGPTRSSLMLASARCLLAANRAAEAWYPLAEAAKDASSAKLLRQADRLLKQAKKKGASPSKRQCRLAILGNSTLDTLAPVLRAQCFAAGIDLDVYIAPFNQVVQEIRQPDSGLARFRPEAVLLAMDWRWIGFADEEPDGADAVRRCLSELEGLWKVCQDRWGAQALQCNFEIPADPAEGRLSAALPNGRGRLLRTLNLELWDAADRAQGTCIVDVEQGSAEFGRRAWADPVLWHVAKQHPAAAALPAFGEEIVAVLRAVYGLTAKCVVLDLDGTLWGGVIGEDGLQGIQLGGTPAGEAFVEFQRHLLALSKSGVLLAVCSKNNEDDARQPFREHPEIVIKEGDIALFCANWQAKDENLRAIAKGLNIGTDALVFVDDNPAERARIRQNLPEVEVIQLPSEPALYWEALSRRRLFDKLALTNEDRERTHSIQTNLKRQQLMSSAASDSKGDMDEYLAGLNLVVELFPFDEPNLVRICQLINKTNQFNMTTRRRTEGEVRSLMAQGWYTQAMRVSDRLGDSGLTGVMLAAPEQETLHLDTWLMSCRVMGRKLEEAMFAGLTEYARANGFHQIRCEFIPSPKNEVVSKLFETLGCMPDGEASGSLFYRWSTDRHFGVPAVLQCSDRTQTAQAAEREN
jgi:FkbH-like protein